MKCSGRPFSVIAHLNRITVEVKAEENCLAHAHIIAIGIVDKYPNYKAYRQGRMIRHVIQTRPRRPVSICPKVRGSRNGTFPGTLSGI